MVDYYKILEIRRDAGIEEIKKAYRKKAKTHHPDVSQSSTANVDFALINEAYATLTDPDKKRKYDLRLAYGDYFAKRVVKKETDHQKQQDANYRKRYGSSAKKDFQPKNTASSNTTQSENLKVSPVLLNLFFGVGMFIGFLMIFLTIGFVYVRLWPFAFLLITLPGFILIKEGWKGINRKHRKKGKIL